MDVIRFIAEWMDISVLLLVALLAMAVYVMREAQKPGNYWGGIFDDDNNKRSALRVAVLICVAVSSAVLMYLTVNTVKGGDDLHNLFPYYIAFLAVWSGAKVVEKLIDLLVARFAK
jgi:hypothetical protein